MYDADRIKELFGDAALEYLTHKNRGGASSARGNTYENFFAVYQLALLAQAVIEEGKAIYIRSQILAFVDDLVIDCQDETPMRHFQLKNRQNVTWGKGLRSISDDFQKQYELNQAVFRISELSLVVSNQEVRADLEASLPNMLKSFSQVIYFPFGPSLDKVIAQEENFLRAVEYLCAFDKPEPDKIECVAKVLLGAWVASDKSNLSVMALLKKAQESTPSFIRSFRQNLTLDPDVVKTLDKIDLFSYNLAKGFFHWSYADGLLEGTLPYSVDSTEFRRFQERVRLNNPTSFEEIEVLL